MKVTDLFEGYHKPHAELSKGKAADGGKKGRMQGAVPDWLKAINDHMTTPIEMHHVHAAREKIETSAAYKDMKSKGWHDVSTQAAVNKGTFVMVRPDGKKYNILVTGKVNDRSGYGGGIRASTLPRILPNDPVGTLVKTMTRSMAELAKDTK